MKKSIKEKSFPEVTSIAKRLGGQIRIARKRRKMTISEMAVRLGISYQTAVRIESVPLGVSTGAVLGALWLFGLAEQFVDAIHPDADAAGKALELSRLPKKVRGNRKGPSYDF